MSAGVKSRRRRLVVGVALAAVVGLGLLSVGRMFGQHANSSEMSRPARTDPSRYVPRASEWASLSVETVSERVFRAERVTEGKIAVNEDSPPPIFSPYAGRVTKPLVKPSDIVARGQPLFIVEATDT